MKKRLLHTAMNLALVLVVLSLSGCMSVRGGMVRDSYEVGTFEVQELRADGLYVVCDLGGDKGTRLVKNDFAAVAVGDRVNVESDMERGEWYVHSLAGE